MKLLGVAARDSVDSPTGPFSASGLNPDDEVIKHKERQPARIISEEIVCGLAGAWHPEPQVANNV